MIPSIRKISVLLVLLIAAGDAQAQKWLDELLVHRTPSFTGENPENCLACHSGDRMRTVMVGPHGNLEDMRAPFSNGGCESCHGPASIHVSRAHGGKGFPPLIGFGYSKNAASRETQVSACMHCHGDTDNGMEVTPFEGTAHDTWIVGCSSCHQVHVDEDPVMNRSSQAEVCYACHAAEAEGHRKVGKRVPDFSRVGCAGCHKVHRLPRNQE